MDLVLLFAILIGATAYQCYFLWRVFALAFRPDQREGIATSQPSVSVIVCFRNEAVGLTKYQSWLEKQSYPNFELIAVDDHSTDESAAIVKALTQQFPQVRLVKPPYPTRAGKKDALTYGISQAKHDILLLTDADCLPVSSNWISLMTAPLANKATTEVVLGVSPYEKTNSIVNHFQRFETLYTAFQYLGLARLGWPYMGVGRNLAYRKTFFERAGGLKKYAHIAGGDDDLLVSHFADKKTTALVTSPESWTISAPANSWKEYWQRKRRHVGVGIHYPSEPKLLIGGLALSHLLHYSLVILLIWWQPNSLLAWSLLGLRWLAVIWVYNQKNGSLEKYPPIQWPLLLLFDFALCFYYVNTVTALFNPGKNKFTASRAPSHKAGKT